MFGLDQDQLLRLLYLVALLAFVAAFGWRGRLSGGLRHLGIWALIFAALLTVYAYRTPLIRFAEPVLRELDPSRVVEVTSPDGRRELVIGRGPDGHFRIDATVNRVPVEFLIDTGATGTVLSFADAERAGIDLTRLEFTRPVQTANGMALFARAEASTLEIGPFRLTDVPVAVMPAGALPTSLLGMSTINRFRGWRIEDNRLILSP